MIESKRSAARPGPWAAVLFIAFVPCALGAQQPDRRVTLEEALQLAYLNHPTTASAEAAVQQAEATNREAWGAFLPSLTVNGIYGNSSNQRFDQATGRLVSTSYTAQTQASYELFSAGRRWCWRCSTRASSTRS